MAHQTVAKNSALTQSLSDGRKWRSGFPRSPQKPVGSVQFTRRRIQWKSNAPILFPWSLSPSLMGCSPRCVLIMPRQGQVSIDVTSRERVAGGAWFASR